MNPNRPDMIIIDDVYEENAETVSETLFGEEDVRKLVEAGVSQEEIHKAISEKMAFITELSKYVVPKEDLIRKRAQLKRVSRSSLRR